MVTLPQKHYLAGLIWCALLGVAYLVMDSQIKPKVTKVSGTANEVVVPRSRDGHFYVAGKISGQPVTFMVDTGASSVSVGRTVAARIGLPSGRTVMVGTANGSTTAKEVTGQTVSLGGIVIQNVRVVILPNMDGEALLGQNVLRHMEVRQTQEQMVLSLRAGA
jgi:aspartyl protease family protein